MPVGNLYRAHLLVEVAGIDTRVSAGDRTYNTAKRQSPIGGGGGDALGNLVVTHRNRNGSSPHGVRMLREGVAMKFSAAMLLVGALAVQGCSAGQACSEVGGFNGVSIEIPRAMFVTSGEVTVDVCDADNCASATQRLGPVPEGPVGREVNVTFEDLGRDFEPGQVSLGVELSNSDGEITASTQRDIELMSSFPNGQSCDGDGYVVGSLKLDTTDRV